MPKNDINYHLSYQHTWSYVKGNEYTFKGNNSDMAILTIPTESYSYRKEFVPSGSKFFLLREALIMKGFNY